MPARKPPVYVDGAPEVLAELAAICGDLPETVQQQSWGGTRWRIRQRTFAEVVAVDQPGGPITVLSFRAEGDDLDVLCAIGHPFRKAAWGTNVVWMTIEADVDWSEVRELLTDSYCVLAPKRLAASVERPSA